MQDTRYIHTYSVYYCVWRLWVVFLEHGGGALGIFKSPVCTSNQVWTFSLSASRYFSFLSKPSGRRMPPAERSALHSIRVSMTSTSTAQRNSPGQSSQASTYRPVLGSACKETELARTSMSSIFSFTTRCALKTNEEIELCPAYKIVSQAAGWCDARRIFLHIFPISIEIYTNEHY